jgi:diguanylate cyclase (GGDEF)-like protein
MGPLKGLDGFRKSAILFISVILVALIAWSDYATGPQVSFAIFYLIPIYLVTWYAGLGFGLAMSAASIVLLSLADLRGNYALLQNPVYDWDILGKLGFFIITAILLGRLRDSYAKAREMSRLDFLTGVANAREFYAVAETERLRSLRYKHVLSLAFLDLDGFKEINDKLGHSVGDKVLMAVAEGIHSSIRSIDMVARVGGDEFVILLPETDERSSNVVMSKLHTVLKEVVAKNGWQVTFSIGVVTFETAPESLDAMIREADQLMYSVKNTGKNRVAHAIAGPASSTRRIDLPEVGD